VRVLAEARLAALGAPDGPAATGALAPPDKNDGGKNALANIPQAIAAVLAAKGELSGRDPGRELITLARKMLEDEQDGKRQQEELA
jgi:hypothetical protein